MKKTLHYINWLAKLCPAFYPVMIAKTLFSVLSPYITLYMSAVILNEILSERRVGYLITVVLFTVVLNCILGLLTRITRQDIFRPIGQARLKNTDDSERKPVPL